MFLFLSFLVYATLSICALLFVAVLYDVWMWLLRRRKSGNKETTDEQRINTLAHHIKDKGFSNKQPK